MVSADSYVAEVAHVTDVVATVRKLLAWINISDLNTTPICGRPTSLRGKWRKEWGRS